MDVSPVVNDLDKGFGEALDAIVKQVLIQHGVGTTGPLPTIEDDEVSDVVDALLTSGAVAEAVNKVMDELLM